MAQPTPTHQHQGGQSQHAWNRGADAKGQQPDSRSQITGQNVAPQQFRPAAEYLPPQMRALLSALQDLTLTAQWCADMSIQRGPELAPVAWTCLDVVEVAQADVRKLGRYTQWNPGLFQASRGIYQAAREVLSQYRLLPIQRTVAVLDQTIGTIQETAAWMQEAYQTGGLDRITHHPRIDPGGPQASVPWQQQVPMTSSDRREAYQLGQQALQQSHRLQQQVLANRGQQVAQLPQ